jgi:hypothetical protein
MTGQDALIGGCCEKAIETANEQLAVSRSVIFMTISSPVLPAVMDGPQMNDVTVSVAKPDSEP